MSVLWEIFGWIGIVATVLLLLWLCGEIRDKIIGRRAWESRAFHREICKASVLPLKEAVNVLTEAGLGFGDRDFILPECFWDRTNIPEKARALIVLIKHRAPNASSECQRALIGLLMIKVRKYPQVALAIACELGKQSGDELTKYLRNP